MFTQLLPIIYIFCFFAIIMTFDAAINFFARNSFIGYKYRYFVAPGVIVHEFSHAIAAILTFHKVEKINIFDPNGGYVIHQKTREPVSQVIISFAPIIGISLSFLASTYLLQPGWLAPLDHYSINSVLQILASTSFSSWQTWLYFYLCLSFATCLAPSKQDFKVAFAGILFILLILFLISISSYQPNLLNFLQHGYLVAIFIIVFLTLALLISLLFYIITRVIDIN